MREICQNCGHTKVYHDSYERTCTAGDITDPYDFCGCINFKKEVIV